MFAIWAVGIPADVEVCQVSGRVAVEGVGVDVESLRYAITLAEELHFGRSARLHHIGEVQFGRRIRQIESDVGVRIFQRTSRSVVLTTEGRAVVMQARRVLDELEELRRPRIHSDRVDATRIGVLGFGVGVRWRRIRDLVLIACPGLQFVHQPLTLADQYTSVLRGKVDVALVHYLGDIDGLDLQFVMRTPRVAVVPAYSNVARARQITRENSDGQQWLRLSGGDDRFAEWAGPHVTRSTGPWISTLDTVSVAVATTGMLGMHGAAAEQFYAHPDVRFIPMVGDPISTAVATRADDERPEVQAFRTAARFVADLPGDA